MSTVLRAAIFNHKTVLLDDPALVTETRTVLRELKKDGISIVVFSTHDLPIDQEFGARRYPDCDLFVQQSDVGKKKGSQDWIYYACTQLNLMPHEFVYVGDDMQDWTTAINAPTIYLHALWVSPMTEPIVAVPALRPIDVLNFCRQYLYAPPRWEYAIDAPEYPVHLRSLLDARTVLSREKNRTFKLQDVFTYEQAIDIGSVSARNLLMHQAVTSLYCEGLIPRGTPRPYFAVYPSSDPAKENHVLTDFVRPVASIFHGYFKENLIIRAVKAADTSRFPNEKKFTTQTNSVHLSPDYRTRVKGKTIFVFDDFTTHGYSLEWARNLLYAAGAVRVILVTVGWYSTTHVAQVPINTKIIKPFELKEYTLEQFSTHTIYPIHRIDASDEVKRFFRERVAMA